MKFFHLSDLHLGKRVNEFSMLEDQRHILTRIVALAGERRPNAVLIAGDVYDRSVPSEEAVQLLDRFLVDLHGLGIAILLIAGNHDSAERVAFAASLLRRSGVHIAQGDEGETSPVVLDDAFGQVRVWLLPYCRSPQMLASAVANLPVDTAARNVLVAHQFVTGAQMSESEEMSVGGAENVDAALFGAFDYVALGHIHRAQKVGRETLRYCGTPLKYSFSEIGHKKSITVVEMGKKGEISIEEIPLRPLREMREIRGSYAEATARESYEGTDTGDYIHMILTDEEDEPDAIMKLRTIYPRLMRLDYDNRRTRAGFSVEGAPELEAKSPLELLDELYRQQNGQPMNTVQADYARELFSTIEEGKR